MPKVTVKKAGLRRRIALANALMLLVIVSSGATVRLTASGLGCPKWPGCEGATKLPARDHYQQIEFSNRLVSGVTILLTLVRGWRRSGRRPAALGTRRRWRRPRRARAGAARRDHRLLRPASPGSSSRISSSRSRCSMLGVLVAIEAWDLRSDALPARLRQLDWSSASRAPSWWSPARSRPRRARFPAASTRSPSSGSGKLYDSMWVHVRATAVFGISLLVLAILLARRGSRDLRYAIPIFVVLAAQMAVGEIQYRIDMLWWIVLIHVTLAMALWASTVAFVAVLWRPRDGSRMARSGTRTTSCASRRCRSSGGR